jgi:hypothetical protein
LVTLYQYTMLHIPRIVRSRSHESQGGSGPDCRPSPDTGEDQPLDAEAQHLAQDSPPDVDFMIPDHNAPPSYSIEGSNDVAHIDPQLAMTMLQQVELPPICVNWGLGYRFLIHQFQPEYLFCSRIHTFQYIPGDARPIFRQCYTAVPQQRYFCIKGFFLSSPSCLPYWCPRCLDWVLMALWIQSRQTASNFLKASGPIYILLLTCMPQGPLLHILDTVIHFQCNLMSDSFVWLTNWSKVVLLVPPISVSLNLVYAQRILSPVFLRFIKTLISLL